MLVLDFQFRPSRQYITAMLAILCAHCILFFFLPCNGWILGFISVLVLTHGCQVVLRYGFLRHKRSIMGITFGSSGWLLQTPLGTFPATLKGESVVTTKVSLLLFQLIDRKGGLACIVCRDSFIDSDRYRALLVTLRMLK